ncbi:response regulator [Bizionia saleffrena]|uniref:Response regulator n=1 Tax=Bizionia saleffrena TaxID=291189 RepID=A0A8H2LH42_9FLAO|nr:response regulator [Bizionia saleffrena]TYB74471.1 response regulator [Bizionia saleffrena]
MLELKSKFKRVMIIDDNTIDLYITARLITKYNFAQENNQYKSALKALDFLKENQNNFSELPEIIFVDIYMPIMSGFEFMEEYDKLSLELRNHCKVYIISSSIDGNDIKRANDNVNVVAFQVKTITKEFLDSI